jgi:hypothetical protein
MVPGRLLYICTVIGYPLIHHLWSSLFSFCPIQHRSLYYMLPVVGWKAKAIRDGRGGDVGLILYYAQCASKEVLASIVPSVAKRSTFKYKELRADQEKTRHGYRNETWNNLVRWTSTVWPWRVSLRVFPRFIFVWCTFHQRIRSSANQGVEKWRGISEMKRTQPLWAFMLQEGALKSCCDCISFYLAWWHLLRTETSMVSLSWNNPLRPPLHNFVRRSKMRGPFPSLPR